MLRRSRLADEQRELITEISVRLILMWLVATPAWLLGFWLAGMPAVLYIIMGAVTAFGVGWSVLLLALFYRR